MQLRVTDEIGQFTISGGAVAHLRIKLDDFCVECFGAIVAPEAVGSAPHVQFASTKDGQPALTIQLWSQRVIMPGQRVFAEVRWSPEFGLASLLRNIDASPSEVTQAMRLYRFWMERVVRGRPPGSGQFASRDEFLAVIGPVISKLHQQGRRATQREVSDFFSCHSSFPLCDERQLRRWAKQFGFATWQDLLREIS
jgi:hypothetical protein